MSLNRINKMPGRNWPISKPRSSEIQTSVFDLACKEARGRGWGWTILRAQTGHRAADRSWQHWENQFSALRSCPQEDAEPATLLPPLPPPRGRAQIQGNCYWEI